MTYFKNDLHSIVKDQLRKQQKNNHTVSDNAFIVQSTLCVVFVCFFKMHKNNATLDQLHIFSHNYKETLHTLLHIQQLKVFSGSHPVYIVEVFKEIQVQSYILRHSFAKLLYKINSKIKFTLDTFHAQPNMSKFLGPKLFNSLNNLAKVFVFVWALLNSKSYSSRTCPQI